MSEYRYAIATIQIPLKVFPNEEYEMLMENLNITFTSTDTLPKSNETEIAEEFQAIIKSIFEPPAKIDDTDINKMLKDLEIEVNKIKAVLRLANIIGG